MSLKCCPYIYNPLEHTSFTVHFNPEEGKREQQARAQRVIAHLDTLQESELVEQSIRFYKWIVLYHTTDSNFNYAQRLLTYFHGRGLLQCKQQVNNDVKQCTQRYLVIFTMKEHVFAKTYNSIRELRADTGKKPSQIQCLPTNQLMCKILKQKRSIEGK